MQRSPAVRIVIAIVVLAGLALLVRYGGASLMDTMRRLHHRS
jgi:hypothetical protein